VSAYHHLADFLFIVLLVAFTTLGDLLMARAMRKVGDVDALHEKAGFFGVVRRVLARPSFYGAFLSMALSFFSLLISLSLIDLSIVIPASSSLTFLATLLGAKFFLKEHVDVKRWIAGAMVTCGIILLALE
jgi:drug/metabolite transporter (DMT)-like permease